MHPIKRFIERNRQTGTTTALVDLITRVGGYLVVAKQATKMQILKTNPQLADQIITAYEAGSNLPIGKEKNKVFFDTDIVYSICEDTKCNCDDANKKLIEVCQYLCKIVNYTFSIDIYKNTISGDINYNIECLPSMGGYPIVIKETTLNGALDKMKHCLVRRIEDKIRASEDHCAHMLASIKQANNTI